MSIAVITGAASGIGLSMAKIAILKGMSVVMTDVNLAGLQEAADTLTKLAKDTLGKDAGQILIKGGNISKYSDVEIIHAAAMETFGSVDLLVNCAGVLINKRIWEHEASDWDFVMGVNFRGMTHMISAFVPDMIKRGAPAHIVNFGSLASFFPSPMMGAYSCSKFAILAMTETLKYELDEAAPHIGVSLVAPGPVKTSIIRSNDSEVLKRDSKDGVKTREQMGGLTELYGMEPDEAAHIIFEAVAENRFWVFTHPDFMVGMTPRTTDMLSGENPSYNPLA
jgi:NAD(P)-dependent dehydrogenase (short-subunit alcohol dehydrogenase family)